MKTFPCASANTPIAKPPLICALVAAYFVPAETGYARPRNRLDQAGGGDIFPDGNAERNSLK